MKKRILILVVMVAALGLILHKSHAQNPTGAGQGVTNVQLTTPYYALTAINSVSASVNTGTTLTIPAPPAGQFNYICSLGYELGFSAGGAAVATNLASTGGVNLNNFTVKVSNPGVASTDTGIYWVIPPTTPGLGCAKSTAAATATTFISPTPPTYGMWSWYATYYQAP